MWGYKEEDSFEPDITARRILVRFLFKLKILNDKEHKELVRLMRRNV